MTTAGPSTGNTAGITAAPVLRQPAEILHAEELAALAAHDDGERPAGWRLSPRQVVTFICGSEGKALKPGRGAAKKPGMVISRKYHGDDRLAGR
jgi:hypothetical protein